MRSFSDALEAIPMALAENSGLGGIEVHLHLFNFERRVQLCFLPCL
jgi:hypothetical protein